MRKLLFLVAMAASVASYAQECKPRSCAGAACCEINQCDSVNIPVFIVDGVEVQDISGLASDDIIKVDIIKDSAMTKIFSPRLGGIVLITTKSKKFLTPILEDYNNQTEAQRQQRIPGKLLVR